MAFVKILSYRYRLYREIRSRALLMVVQLENISHLEEASVKVTQFRFFVCFSFRGLISSYKVTDLIPSYKIET